MNTTGSVSNTATAGPVDRTEVGAFPWAALLQPGLIRAGNRWLSLAPRMWVHWAGRIVRDALDRTLERAVSVEALSDSERVVQKELTSRGLSAREAAFVVALSHPTLGDAHVVLDLTAARIIVDSLEADFASVRGAETLSDAELGLLEYATLACVDHALRAVAPVGQALAITDFPDPGKFRDQVEADQRYRTTLRLRVAGRQGFVRVYIAKYPAEPPEAPTEAAPIDAEQSAGVIELRLAFPPLKISRDELKSLRPGDLLLTGVSDMTATAGFRLATASGWNLALAMVVRDSATSMTVRTGAISPDVREAGEGERVVLTPLVGRVPVTLDQFKHAAAEGTFELQKDATAPVEIFDGNDRVARGELLKIDNEIGIRLLECRR